MATLRRLTKEQFSALTTIDGNRIDRAVDDAMRRANGLLPDDLRRKMVQQQIVLGWQPCPNAAAQHVMPWLDAYNGATALYGIQGTVPDWAPQNPYRIKGSYNAAINESNGAADLRTLLVWTTALWFERPVIFDGLSLHMLVDAVAPYTNNLVYGAAPPTGKTAGAPLSDLFIEVSVDNPWQAEDAKQSAVEYKRYGFQVSAVPFSNQIAPPAGWVDMAPAHPSANVPEGIAVDDQGLNIPIPGKSRVRFSVAIPEYNSGVARQSGWSRDGIGGYTKDPWQTFNLSSVITVLESLVE
jgi:hypothetical protein